MLKSLQRHIWIVFTVTNIMQKKNEINQISCSLPCVQLNKSFLALDVYAIEQHGWTYRPTLSTLKLDISTDRG